MCMCILNTARREICRCRIKGTHTASFGGIMKMFEVAISTPRIINCSINMSAFQGLAQFCPQVFHRKWFVDEMHAFVKHTVVDDDVGGIAGHE